MIFLYIILPTLVALGAGIFIALRRKNFYHNQTVLLHASRSDHQFSLPVSKIAKITHDTNIYTLRLPNPNMTLGIDVGQHISIHARVPSLTPGAPAEEIMRKYTPISKVDQKGSVDLLIKIYRKTEKFPNGGRMSLYFDSLKVGDEVRISGPRGKLSYLGQGKIKLADEETKITEYKKIGMIAGGSGITPVYQIIRDVYDNPKDNVSLNLLFANKHEDDILLHEELRRMHENKRLSLALTLDNPPTNWKQYSGFINREMLEKTMPPPGPTTFVCHCGPPPMNVLVRKLLLEIGHKEENIFKF